MSEFIVRAATPDDMSAVSALCWAYRDLLIERSEGLPPIIETYYAEDQYAELIADLPRIHARPKGDILVATRDQITIGCAMYYPISDDVCEIKRVFVAEHGRGSGAGRALMLTSMERARSDGYKRIVLDTLNRLTEARALYEQTGFRKCEPFYEPDPEFAPYLRFYDTIL